ncbi:MAG: trypsin-like peptidase domain-containing protein [Gemmataceae bacterium]|nr:trypsin-like peptidase domain-containing protein [Gemmataceae bacterium]
MKRFTLVFACLALGALGFHLGSALLQGQAPIPAAAPRDLTSYRGIVKRVLPAVVSLEALAKDGKRLRPGRPGDMQLPDDLRHRFEAPRFDGPRGAADDPDRIGFGSGFVVSPKGVIVTNNHVVGGADRVAVTFHDGKRLISRKVFTDPKTDLALVVVEARDALPSLEFGDSEAMEIGDRVLAVGAPFGLTGTVTSGIVSSTGRSLRMNMYEDFIQTDAAINPGNSGGPLVNMEGKVIGITSAIKSRSGGFQGIGLAISSNLGRKIVEALLKDGTVRRGYLGVGIRDLTEERARELGLKAADGVEVTAVYPDAPGDKAGLKEGDVLLRLGGKPVRNGRILQEIVIGLPLGKPARADLVRGKEEVRADVTIEEQPKDYGTSRSGIPDIDRDGLESKKAGLALFDLTPELKTALKFPSTARGPVVLRLKRRGLAARAGLEPGLLVTKVDGKAVRNAREAVAALEADGTEIEARGPTGTAKTFTLRE